MLTSLHIPDDLSWQEDPDYSPEVALALRHAFSAIHADHQSVAMYARAWACVKPYQNAHMSTLQRQHIIYLSSLCLSAQSDYREAISCLDDVLDISAELDDAQAFAESAYLRGSTNNALLQYHESANDFTLAIETLRDAQIHLNLHDPKLELYILTGLAGAQFMLARPQLTLDILDEAQLVVQKTPSERADAALLAWLRAIVFRWWGLSGQALPLAMDAAEALAWPERSESSGRIQTIVADIALDHAETFTVSRPNYAHESFVSLAEPYAARALSLARRDHDVAGEGLALLARVRCDRMGRRIGDRTRTIEGVIKTAKQCQDPALLCQAYMALGLELTAEERIESARQCYHSAQQVVASTSVRAFDVLAQRALARLNETHTT